ncbi:MAG: hypothetical protein ACD_13C00246G0002 [uncultured bacterium]|nr:MAG: hypothetical protein ACD_13C00246G0002 [uncultured bacterium]
MGNYTYCKESLPGVSLCLINISRKRQIHRRFFQCQEFDLGISAARLEVSKAEIEYSDKPSKLYHYLLNQPVE